MAKSVLSVKTKTICAMQSIVFRNNYVSPWIT